MRQVVAVLEKKQSISTGQNNAGCGTSLVVRKKACCLCVAASRPSKKCKIYKHVGVLLNKLFSPFQGLQKGHGEKRIDKTHPGRKKYENKRRHKSCRGGVPYLQGEGWGEAALLLYG